MHKRYYLGGVFENVNPKNAALHPKSYEHNNGIVLYPNSTDVSNGAGLR